MATVSGDSSRSLAVGGWAVDGDHDSKSERYLAKRLAAASSDYKGVALITFVLAAAVGTLAWLGAGVMLDHWLVPGGLPRWGRSVWLATWGIALAAAIVRWIVPLVRYRVNLVYAARVIERDHPDLHNDIVNAVLVKAHADESAPMVVRSLERRAARSLAAVPAEGVIDRGPAVRLAAALAVLVALACVYQVVGPKSMFTSFARLVAPWSTVAAPARVQLSAPRLFWRMPGDDRPADGDALAGQQLLIEGETATLVRGRQLVVAAEIRGLRRDERPVVQVVPMRDDGAIDPAAAAWEVGMERRRAAAGAGDTFVAVLPDAARGIDHGLEFVLAAGDARSEPLRIAVVDSPSLLVRELRYEYPPYTRLPPETVPWQGDVRAVEGTRVTVVAESNRPLETAWIEFDGSGRRDRAMKVGASDLARATGSFDLAMNADRSRAEHASYRLVFRPRGANGAKEEPLAEQMDHRIEVVADLAPEVSIEEPRESPLRVPAEAPVAVRVRALDPDFGLARVGLEMRFRDGKPLPDLIVLDKETSGGTSGGFKGVARFVPTRLGAGGGAVVEYRAFAVDTRPKQPNVAHSNWQTIVIDPSAPPQRQDQRTGDQSRDAKDGSNGNDGRQPGGEQENNEQQKGQPEDRQRQESGDDQPEGKDEPGDQSGASDGSQGGQQQSKDAGEAGAKQQGSDQSGDGQNQNGGQNSGQQSGPKQQAGGEQASGQQGQPRPDQQQPGNQRGGQKGGSNAQQSGGEQSGGEKQSGAKDGPQKPRDNVAADGTNDGEAMERILDHKRQQEGGQQSEQGDKQPSKQSPQGGDQNGDQQKNQKNNQKQDCPDCAGADGKPCGKEGCSSCKGGAAGSSGKSSGQGAGENAAGQEGSSQQSGEPTGGQSGEQSGGQPGKQPGQPGQQPGQQSGAGQPADGQQAGDKPSDGSGEQGAGKAAGEQGSGEPSQGQPSGGSGAGAAGKGDQGGKGDTREQSKDGEGADRGERPDEGERKQQGQQRGEAAEGTQAQGPREPGSKSAAEETSGQAGTAGKEGGTEAGDEPGAQPGAPQPGQPSDQVSPTGRGGWSNGERRAATGKDDSAEPLPAKETEWVEQELARARNAADLAIEHLRKSVAEGRTDVLEQLGWTADQARAFLDRWDAMRRMAGSDDPRQRGEFERAIRSLGLRPGGVRTSRDVPADVKGGQAEGRRSRPPSEYRDQVKAYLQGAATE